MPKTLVIPKVNGWDSVNNEFVEIESETITIEHSLISLQRWESKWHIPYMSTEQKTPEQVIDYIQCMTMSKVKDPRIFMYIPEGIMQEIADYISNPMTATTFNDNLPGASKFRKEVITAEIIYYWMIALNIPESFKKWHLNQLLTLIKVCELKQEKPKKMPRNALVNRNRALNAARKARLNTHG